MGKEYKYDKMMFCMANYDACLEEMKSLAREINKEAKQITQGLQDLSMLSDEETGKILQAVEEMKVSHAEFLVTLQDNNII